MIIEEFETSNVFLRHPDRRVFYSSAWSQRFLVPFLAYRVAMALFTLFILIYSFGDYIVTGYGAAWFFIYATNWTLLIQTIYYNMAAVVTALACCNIGTRLEITNSRRVQTTSRRTRLESLLSGENGNLADAESDSEDTEEENQTVEVSEAPPDDLCWYHKTMWVLYNVMAPIALMITFSRSLAMGLNMSFEWARSGLDPLTDILHHFCNGAIVVVDIFVSATPTRILHVIHPIAYSCIYNVFLVVYWVSGGWGITGKRWVYPVVDYSDDNWRASAIFVFAGLFVVLPVFHLLVFGLYKLRCAIVRCVVGTTTESPERTRLLSE
ncbi:protein rolling stone-like isoform X2 [Branchiostoma lanceolatum]|uniref:protein rolling stone-like isoform X2 n=1 Tax=Branchiostoma lanceolatum TaxID=7740 RepID=UPI003456F2A3